MTSFEPSDWGMNIGMAQLYTHLEQALHITVQVSLRPSLLPSLHFPHPRGVRVGIGFVYVQWHPHPFSFLLPHQSICCQCLLGLTRQNIASINTTLHSPVQALRLKPNSPKRHLFPRSPCLSITLQIVPHTSTFHVGLFISCWRPGSSMYRVHLRCLGLRVGAASSPSAQNLRLPRHQHVPSSQKLNNK